MRLPPTPPTPVIQPVSQSTGGVSRGKLRAIAKYQRVILVCILSYVALVVFQFSLPPAVALLLAIPGLVLLVIGAIHVFLLATCFYSKSTGILLGILSLIPLLGMIAMLIVSQKATSTLKQHGVSVGLLGTDPNKIR